MSEPAFDELIHAPLRLQICSMLGPVQSLGFADLRDSLGISDSVLSKHLSVLAEAGYVQISRVRANARSRRQVALTESGRAALRGHLAALQAIAAMATMERTAERTAPPAPPAPARRRPRRGAGVDPLTA